MLSNSVENFKGGKLSDYFDKWRAVTNDHEILQAIRGLPINITNPVDSLKTSFQHKLSKDELMFMDSEIQTLLAKKVIRECLPEEGEFVSPTFTRAKSDGGLRLILNLKNLNKAVPYKHFKMETVSTILTLVRPNWFMAKIDLKDAYYSVRVRSEDQKLLKFRHRGKLYQFVCLPNGYSEGPRVFTKLVKPLLASLREEDIIVAIYIDDLFTISETYESCLQQVKHIACFLDEMGFTINTKKSVFAPSQVMEFLGFSIDSRDMSVTLTDEKKVALKTFCEETLTRVSMPIRHAACLLGKFNSSCLAVPHGKLHFRDLDRDKTRALTANKWNFDKCFTLSDRARDDIRWWATNILEASAPIGRGTPSLTLTTDASGHGWGAVIDDSDGTGGLFSESERELHINVKETMAVRFGLESLCDAKVGQHFRIMIDNQAAVGSINKMGSFKSRTLYLAVKVV